MVFTLTVIMFKCLITPSSATSSQNNEDCLDRNDRRGIKYRGTRSRTVNGRVCQKWTLQRPNAHSRTYQTYPNAGLGDHNYCRNPDNEQGPWCYNGEGTSPRWEFCEIPFCADWLKVEKGIPMKYNLERYPLNFKTSSLVGSKDIVGVVFYGRLSHADESRQVVAVLELYLSRPPMILLNGCNEEWKPLNANLE
ncbi:hypothetical protein ACHWQZ_G007216 [Mnemiopsis leidyi]